jgi:hypothetical protein
VNDEKRDLLADVKVGDVLAYDERNWRGLWVILAKVERETQKEVLSGAHRFRRSDGKCIGASWCVRVATDADFAAVERQRRRNAIERCLHELRGRDGDLTDGELAALEAALRPVAERLRVQKAGA